MKTLPILLIAGTSIYAACGGSVQQANEKVEAATYTIPDSVKVPVAEARALVANYAPYAGEVVVAPGDTTSNTRAVWFSLEQLEALVAQIDAEGGDGIRFYLARYNDTYPEGSATHIPPREYWGRNTLLMVSTRAAENAQGKPIHQDYYEDVASAARPAGPAIMAEIENDGGLCPPACDGTDLLEPEP
ncbi:hypothetical protein [Parapedobacter sp. 2B3]|uniref:hypothetical protein n=1 Tax=Parapedobacter sp. 2B3 TaxID=3342381 RepID=UPI0035B684A3